MKAIKTATIMPQILRRLAVVFPLLLLISGCAVGSGFSSDGIGTANSSSQENSSGDSSLITLTLNVNIPIDIDDAASAIKIAGNMNAWNPLDENYRAQKVDEYNYFLRL